MNEHDITALRKALGLSQPEFGRLFGVHPMTVSKWERGLLEPNEYQLALMQAFQKSVRDTQIKQAVKSALVGAGIAAALLLLLEAADRK